MADNPYERDYPPGATTPDRAGDAPPPAPLPNDAEPGEDWPRRVEDGPYTGEDREDTPQATTPAPTTGSPDGLTQPLPTERTTSPAAAPERTTSPAPAPERTTSPAAAPERTTSPAPAAATRPITPATGASGDDAVTSTFDLRDRPGQHEAERPVPRSGLTEHRSAGYLTGELSPPQPAASPSVTGREEPAATEQIPAPPAEELGTGPDPAVVLDGATVAPKLPSRAGAHVGTVILTLLLTPVAWYLVADAGARLTQPAGNPWDTANLNVAALLELVGGLLVLAVVLLAARWSSLGAIITGSLVLIVGVPFIAVPAWTQDLLVTVTDWLHTLGDFGGNVAAHLVASGSTGRLVVYGLALILIGVVSHGARRRGRREMHTALTT